MYLWKDFLRVFYVGHGSNGGVQKVSSLFFHSSLAKGTTNTARKNQHAWNVVCYEIVFFFNFNFKFYYHCYFVDDIRKYLPEKSRELVNQQKKTSVFYSLKWKTRKCVLSFPFLFITSKCFTIHCFFCFVPFFHLDFFVLFICLNSILF